MVLRLGLIRGRPSYQCPPSVCPGRSKHRERTLRSDSIVIFLYILHGDASRLIPEVRCHFLGVFLERLVEHVLVSDGDAV